MAPPPSAAALIPYGDDRLLFSRLVLYCCWNPDEADTGEASFIPPVPPPPPPAESEVGVEVVAVGEADGLRSPPAVVVEVGGCCAAEEGEGEDP